MSTPTRMPTYFIPHGAGPCFFMDWNPPTTWHRMRDFLMGIADTLPSRPTAIVMVLWVWCHCTTTGTQASEVAYTVNP